METIEQKVWDAYFAEAIEGSGQETVPSFWWKWVHEDLSGGVVNLFKDSTEARDVLEAGCGSATSSFELSRRMNIRQLYLLDISKNALDFAKTKLEINRADDVQFVQGSVYHLEDFREKVDLCWNVGLIEHYSVNEIKEIVKQMFLTLKPEGFLFIGMPNRYSIATLKAALLGSKLGRKYLPFIGGYRNQTEILYGNAKIRRIIEEVAGVPVKMYYAGSPTFVESQESIVRFCKKYMPHSPFSFISCFIAQKRKKNHAT